MTTELELELEQDLLLDFAAVRQTAKQSGTPFYLLDRSRILRSMRMLQDGMAVHYPNCEVTYSVKTNSLPGILAKVLESGWRLEVVSRRELALAQSVGAAPSQILFNGPVKTEADLLFCYENDVDVNVDSLDELEAVAALGSVHKPFRVGLRIAATLLNGNVSRFGIEPDDPAALDTVRRIVNPGTIRLGGLHIHHSSRRDAQSYCDRLDLLADVAGRLGIEPDYLDLGGGIASVPPAAIARRLSYRVDAPEELAAKIGKHARAKFGWNGPRVILEPGIGVLAGAMNYVVSIVAVKHRAQGGHVAVCDGSMFDVNPLRSAIHPPCVLAPSSSTSRPEASGGVPLYGGTCMEIDRLGELDLIPQKGDLAIIANVGAYSSTLAPEFITRRAPVYAVDSQEWISR